MYTKHERIWMTMMGIVLVVITIAFVLIISGFIELFTNTK